MINVELNAIHIALPADSPGIAGAMLEVDLIPDGAFDQQIIFRFIGDAQRFVDIQRDAVAARFSEINYLDIVDFAPQFDQVQQQVGTVKH